MLLGRICELHERRPSCRFFIFQLARLFGLSACKLILRAELRASRSAPCKNRHAPFRNTILERATGSGQPVFRRFGAHLSHLESTPANSLASVDSKAFTRTLSRLDATLTKNRGVRSEEHTSELQSRRDLVCRLLL